MKLMHLQIETLNVKSITREHSLGMKIEESIFFIRSNVPTAGLFVQKPLFIDVIFNFSSGTF